MLFCDSCDRGFHMECCDPPLSRMPKGELLFTPFADPPRLSHSPPTEPCTQLCAAVTHRAESQCRLIRAFCEHIKLFAHPLGADWLSAGDSADPTARAPSAGRLPDTRSAGQEAAGRNSTVLLTGSLSDQMIQKK